MVRVVSVLTIRAPCVHLLNRTCTGVNDMSAEKPKSKENSTKIEWKCPCGNSALVPAYFYGRTVKCPKCGALSEVGEKKTKQPASASIQTENRIATKVNCPKCDVVISMPPEQLRKKTKCPRCSFVFVATRVLAGKHTTNLAHVSRIWKTLAIVAIGIGVLGYTLLLGGLAGTRNSEGTELGRNSSDTRGREGQQVDMELAKMEKQLSRVTAKLTETERELSAAKHFSENKTPESKEKIKPVDSLIQKQLEQALLKHQLYEKKIHDLKAELQSKDKVAVELLVTMVEDAVKNPPPVIIYSDYKVLCYNPAEKSIEMKVTLNPAAKGGGYYAHLKKLASGVCALKGRKLFYSSSGSTISNTTQVTNINAQYRCHGERDWTPVTNIVVFKDESMSSSQSLPRTLPAPSTPSLPSAPPPITVVTGGGHWISKVMDGGRYVKLEDGSLWEVSALDRIDSMLWLMTESIVIVENSSSVTYPYKLVNKDTGDVVEAKPISK